MTGGSIIMPIDISTDATTMSMTRNGRKIRKPISNARRSSLIMNAGSSTRSGTSAAVGRRLSCAISTNSATSSGRTWRSMNARTGALARLNASVSSISSASSGSSPS